MANQQEVEYGTSPSSVASYHSPPGAPSVYSGGIISPSVISTPSAPPMIVPEQSNINFRPTTTAVSKNPKLKLHVLLDSTLFTAGGNIYGRMELNSSTSRSLKLGEISVELTAYEEVTTRDYTASQSFLSSRLVFQGPNMPPSNAVHGPSENGFWAARKGKTTFPFAFKIPVDAPSSVVYGSVASLRYVVTGVAQIIYNGKEDTIFRSKEAFVVEAWDGHSQVYKKPVEATNSRKLWMGGPGSLVLESSLMEVLFTSGGNINVQVRVKNDTKRKVQGLRLAVAHRLIILADKNKREADEAKVIMETLKEEWFRDKDFTFDAGEERSTTVNMYAPPNIRTIRNTVLFEVACYVVVSLHLGPFTKYLSVELPVSICHSASMQPPPVSKMELNRLPNHYNMMDVDEDYEEVVVTGSNAVDANGAKPVDIPDGTRGVPWSNAEEDGHYRGHHAPAAETAGSYTFGSPSPKKLGSLATSFLGRPKQLSPANPSKLIPKSPPLGPASPLAYIPATERVRYLSFGVSAAPQSNAPLKPMSTISGFEPDASRQGSPPPGSRITYEVSPNVREWLSEQSRQSPESPNGSPVMSGINQSPNGTPQSKPTPPRSSVSPPRSASPWSNLGRIQEHTSTVYRNSASPPRQSPPSPTSSPFMPQRLVSPRTPIPGQPLSDDAFQRCASPVSSPKGPSGLTLLMNGQKAHPPSAVDVLRPVSPSYDHIPKGRPLPIPQPKNPPQTAKNMDNGSKLNKPEFLTVPGMADNNVPRASAPGVVRNSPATSAGVGGLSALLNWGASLMNYGSVSAEQSESHRRDPHVDSEKTASYLNPTTSTQPAPDAPCDISEAAQVTSIPSNVSSENRGTPALILQQRLRTISPPPPEKIPHAPSNITDVINNQKSSTQAVNKAFIFAALGQRSPEVATPKNSPSPPSKPSGLTAAISPEHLSARNISAPFTKGSFQVARKPLGDNKYVKEGVDAVEATAKRPVPPAIQPKPPLLKATPPTPTSTARNENLRARALAAASNYSSNIATVTANPPSQSDKVIASTPTTYVNTTLAKTMIPTQTHEKPASSLPNEESLTLKITEPPKQSLSPRLQEYIKKYSVAAGMDRR